MIRDTAGGSMPGKFRTARPRAQLRQGRTDWYKITNSAAGAPAQVHVYDEIGYWGVTASDFIAELSSLDAQAIDLHINSPGGEIFDGIAIMNALRAHPATVTTYVDSLAASIASVIALAGDRVVMAKHSQMMIHDGSGLCVGDAADMRNMAVLLDRQSDNIAAVYAEKAGGTVKQWRARMTAETWFTAAEAVEAGLADEVSSTRTSPNDNSPQNSWDLSVFNYAGRENAPAPTLPTLVDTATPVHHTATVDGTWDAGVQEKKLPSPMTIATAKAMYGWYDSSAVDGGDITKDGCKLPHHEVSADGTPGAANLAGVRNALSRLPQSDIPEAERAAVERHLQAHLSDAEPADSIAGDFDLTDWDPAVLKDAIGRATGELTDWDPALFRDAVHASAADARAVTPTTPLPAPNVQAGWAEPSAPAPEPERDSFGEIFRAALQLAADNAPAPTAPAPAAEPEPEPYDPTVVTRALREEVRR